MPELSGQTLVARQVSDIRRKLGLTAIPIGGGTGDVLVKLSPANYDIGWAAILGGLVTAGNGIVFAGNTVHFAQAAAYTAGAIAFASGAATMGFDPAALFWDAANDRLGLGTNVPAGRLHVTQDYTDLADTFMSRHNATQTTSGAFKRAFYSSFETVGAGNFVAGLNSAGIFHGLHSGSGDVVTGFALNMGCEIYGGKSALGTGNMGGSVGLFVQSVNQNAIGTITTAYDIYIQTPITTGAITRNLAIFQASPDAFSFFGGGIVVGTQVYHDNDMIRCERTYTTAGHPGGVSAILGFNITADTAEFSAAGSFTVTSYSAFNFTNLDGVMGCQAQALHDGTGTVTGLTGLRGYAGKINTGPVSVAYAGRFRVFNSNVTGAIVVGRGLYVETPGVTGAITTYYGLYLSAGAGTTVYGIAQVGTSDLNYLAGYSAFGSTAPVNTTFALFGASTAAISSQRIVKGSAAYAGAVEGDLWNDYAQGCLIAHISGLKQYDERVCFVQTADKTVTNTNAETTLFGAGIGTLTLPANFFVAGKTIRVTLRGHHTMDATPPTITFRVKLGAVTFASVAYTDLNDTNQYFELNFVLTCRTTGAGGTGIGQGYILMSETAGGSPNTDLEQLVMTATAAMNTTGALALDVTAQPSVADAGSSITITNAIVEIAA